MAEYLDRSTISPEELRQIAKEEGLPAPAWEESEHDGDFDATWIKESDREELVVFYNGGTDAGRSVDGELWFIDFRDRPQGVVEECVEGAIRDRDHLRQVLRRVVA